MLGLYFYYVHQLRYHQFLYIANYFLRVGKRVKGKENKERGGRRDEHPCMERGKEEKKVFISGKNVNPIFWELR